MSFYSFLVEMYRSEYPRSYHLKRNFKSLCFVFIPYSSNGEPCRIFSARCKDIVLRFVSIRNEIAKMISPYSLISKYKENYFMTPNMRDMRELKGKRFN